MVPTIKVKFLCGFFIIFAVSLLLMNHFVVQIIEKSNENIMTQDMISIQKNSSVYVKQAFMINHFTHDEMYFQQIAQEIAEDLQHATSSDISVYSIKGELLYTSDSPYAPNIMGDDLRHALNGQTSYTIQYENHLKEVDFSYPVVIDGKKVGILRFAKDFSYLYEQSKQILDFIFYITAAIFTAAFLFSYLLSRNITIPIVKLSKITTAVTSGNLDVRIPFQRKDEIGRLAMNFKQMLDKIKLQIYRMKQDRDRLEELNHHRKRFFDNMTHELKTPLTSILGYAQMIQENKGSDEVFFNKGMNHIVEESRRLQQMVVSLLELSKETSTQERAESVDTRHIVLDVCEGMAFKAERYKKMLRCEAADGLMVFGNANKLRQLMINVIDNAIKYSDPHSDIYVLARLVQDQVQITIRSIGDEIGEEQLTQLFKPLYQAGTGKFQEAGSSGLGLSICKAIVEDHQGSIAITSANHETRVTVQLPYMKSIGEPI